MLLTRLTMQRCPVTTALLGTLVMLLIIICAGTFLARELMVRKMCPVCTSSGSWWCIWFWRFRELTFFVLVLVVAVVDGRGCYSDL